MNAAPVSRWYFRCTDCLSVVATAEEPAGSRGVYTSKVETWECGGCGGRLSPMGRVTTDARARRARLLRESTELACDGRCQGAQGPSCDCKCNGHNHGQTVTREVVRDGGAVPSVMPPDAAHSLAVAREWRTALETVRAPILARYKDAIGRQAAGDWLPPARFAQYRQDSELLNAIRDAAALKTHAGRMKRIAGIQKIISQAT